jgi:hypothetical protein
VAPAQRTHAARPPSAAADALSLGGMLSTVSQHWPSLRESAGAWTRMAHAGAPLMNWFSVACALHRDWRNDIEGLATLLSNHIPAYRNPMMSDLAKEP